MDAVKTYYLIVPALTDQGGQCRIVAREHVTFVGLADYRRNPDAWREAGLMSSAGSLRCLSGPAAHFHAMKDAEPLMACTVHSFPALESAQSA